MKLTRKEKHFLIVTFPFFFLIGPFQTTALLLSGWSIGWYYTPDGPLYYHVLPISQVLENYLGAPAFWFFTWTLYVAYTRGHFDDAIADLLESFKSVDRSKRSNNNQS